MDALECCALMGNFLRRKQTIVQREIQRISHFVMLKNRILVRLVETDPIVTPL